MARKHHLIAKTPIERRMINFYFIGQLESETTKDYPTQHRFKVNGVVYHKYTTSLGLMLSYIEQSAKSMKWKNAAVRWISKAYSLDDETMLYLGAFSRKLNKYLPLEEAERMAGYEACTGNYGGFIPCPPARTTLHLQRTSNQIRHDQHGFGGVRVTDNKVISDWYCNDPSDNTEEYNCVAWYKRHRAISELERYFWWQEQGFSVPRS